MPSNRKPAESDGDGASHVFREHDLIGRQRNAQRVEEHERAGRSVAMDREMRPPLGLAKEPRARREDDYQRESVRARHSSRSASVGAMCSARHNGDDAGRQSHHREKSHGAAERHWIDGRRPAR